MKRVIEFLALAVAAYVVICLFAFAARGSTFRAGVVAPTPISAQVAGELGVSLQRFDLTWDGSATIPPLRGSGVVALYPRSRSYADAEGFCSWAAAVTATYGLHNVIVGNEPPDSQARNYVRTLATCAPRLHALDAFVIAPGLHPALPKYAQNWLDLIRASGARVDAFDVHPYWYSNLAYDREIVDRVHATLGARVQTWIGEDGVNSSGGWYALDEAGQARQVAASMMAARCAGASVWLNFMLRDDPDGWHSGLERADGSRKPAFAAFAAASRSSWCPASPSTAGRGRGTITAHESRRYVCVQRYHGDTFAPNRRNILRGYCVVSTRG